MIRILFVCHGNISRSPMAEFVMKDIVRKAGCEEKFLIASAATTTDDLGSDMYPMAEELRKHGIPFEPRQARQLRHGEYAYWDYIVAMDGENLADIPDLLGQDTEHKVHLLLSSPGRESWAARCCEPSLSGNGASWPFLGRSSCSVER